MTKSNHPHKQGWLGNSTFGYEGVSDVEQRGLGA